MVWRNMVFLPHWPQLLGNKPIHLGLERVLALLEKLGNPHHHLPPVIHLAGTNGKGSTVAFLKAIFQAAGLRVDAYTSPHLVHFNERISLNGKPIEDDYLTQILEECRLAVGDIPVTFFEGTTVGAFLAFARSEADVLILETGLGGRLDATNVIDRPALTLLTSISMDHMEYLGPTLELIAGEKAGILKAGVPCVSSLQLPEAHGVIERRAHAVGAPLFAFGYDWVVEKEEKGMRYQSQSGDILSLPAPSLLGDHQIINAGNAIAACHLLREQGFTLPDSALRTGLTTARWPARMQPITEGRLADLLPKGWELWLDGAHNDAGAQALSCVVEDWQDKPTYLLCGMTKGRDPAVFLRHFKGKAAYIGGVLVHTEPSAIHPQKVAEAAEGLSIESGAFDRVDEAIEYLVANKAPGRILTCGSLYLASDVLRS